MSFEYDYVNVKLLCPYCREELDPVRSTDGPCDLSWVDPTEVYNLHSYCYNCSNWVEYERNPPQQEKGHRDKAFSLEEIQALGFELV